MKKNSKLIVKELFSSSFNIYKKNWLNFVLISIIFVFVSTIGNNFVKDNGILIYQSYSLASLISWLLIIYLNIGFVRYILDLIDGKDVKLKNIFYGVDSIGHFVYVILVSFIASISIIFGLLFLIIPGIVIALGLMFSKYIIIENKGGNIEILEAIKVSWEITKGYRWKLLWVCVLILFLNVIGFLALFIGLIITIPISYIIILHIYRKLMIR